MSISAQPEIVSIKKNTDIRSLLEKGKKIYTKYGIFFLGQEPTASKIFFAVLIKKSVGNAVRRNYCKRIVRVYIRNHFRKFLVFRRVLFLYNFHGEVNFTDLTLEFDKKLEAL